MTPAQLDAAVERALDQREAQGFGRHVSDPAVLDRIAGIVTTTDPPRHALRHVTRHATKGAPADGNALRTDSQPRPEADRRGTA
jgi:hypothetical protein